MTITTRLRGLARHAYPAIWRTRTIGTFSKLNVWYGKGIQVLAFIRNVEITDIGILMALAKYFLGDALTNHQIVAIGAGYWILNTLVNLGVGWFWEHHDGWTIEARIRGQRADPQRAVLVDPGTGRPYGPAEIKEALNHGRL